MSPSGPRVSIGLPVYNGERFLADTLESLLAQTFEDFELILADNASTDATADICRRYAALDSRVRYVRNRSNIGVYRNCNSVFKHSRGEYFKLACADDLCEPMLLARCVQVLNADPTVVATYPRTRFIDQDGNDLGIRDPGWHLMSDLPQERLRYVIVSGHWVNLFFGLTRSKDLAETRLFPLYVGGDCRLLGELSLRGKFFEIPEYLFFRRIHAQAASQNRGVDWHSLFFKGRHGHVELPFWHICLDHCRTIVCSPLSGRDKVSCLGTIVARMCASKRELLRELYTASTYLYRSRLLTSR
jgi:glycosyltransferase involved in cell wall biosynthesis